MEGGYNQRPKQTKTNSALTIHLGNNKANAGAAVRDANVNAPKDVVEHHGKQPLDPSLPKSCVLREQDLYMPIANVIRIMRRILPNHAKISDDAKETVQECVSEFISFITGEANQRCRDEERKTITSEDIVWAMKQLDFNDYIEPITVFLIRYRESQNGRSLVRKEPNSMPHGGGGDGGEVVDYEPLPMVDGSGPLEMGGAGPPGSFGPAGYNLGTQQVFFDPSMMNPYNFRYNNSDSTGGSSSPPGYLPGFNPYAHYK